MFIYPGSSSNQFTLFETKNWHPLLVKKKCQNVSLQPLVTGANRSFFMKSMKKIIIQKLKLARRVPRSRTVKS